jgi:hypothetical protein
MIEKMALLCSRIRLFNAPLTFLQILSARSITTPSNVLPISNNSNFRQQHPGVPVGSDGSDRTLNPLPEEYTLPVAQGTSGVAHEPPLLCAQKVVMYTHHQNDMYDTLFPGAAVML